MCGIAGIVATDATSAVPPSWTAEVAAMLAAVRHRGPDDERIRAVGGAVVGAVRLAVIDAAGGAQPMATPDGRHVLVWNGVVTNHVELRRDLEARGVSFRSAGSDTEVLLSVLAHDGVAGLARVDGMFAGALLDGSSGEVLLFRDPCGIKPLYWCQDADPEGGRRVLFASEPKALLAATGIVAALHDEALLDYLAFQVPLTDSTWFRGIRRVAPGSTLTLRPNHAPVVGALPAWHESFDVPASGEDAGAFLGQLLRESVSRNLRADVAIGAHLSGGVDSSLVASLAARGGPLSVFTGAFDVPGFDERAHAAAVAEEIAAERHEAVITPRDLAEALPLAARAMDEPAAGPGLLPQWCVARLAARHVRVVLGGQGGDELFQGYVRHLVLHLEGALHEAVHGGDTRGLRRISPHLAALDGYEPLLRRQFSSGLFEPAASRAFRLLYRGGGLDGVLAGDLREAFGRHPARERFAARYAEVAGAGDSGSRAAVGDLVRFDRAVTLPALLQVEDRTSMAFSLESRVPLLGRRLLAYVDRVPDAMLLGDGELKGLLRRAASRDLPVAARTRTDKMGFPVPLATWARGPLREFLRDLLLDGTARARGFFDPAGVERVLAGESVEARHLWALANVELWMRSNGS